MSEKKDEKPFWTTLPGILTGFAAVLTAVGGLTTALYAAGLLQIFFPIATVVTPTTTLIRPTATGIPPTTTLIQPTTILVPPTRPVIVVTATPPPIIPTQTATPIRGLEQMVDNFENYSNAFLQENFKINRGAGNDLTLSSVGIPHVSQGTQALAFEYNIHNAPPRHYAGFDRNLPIQDWSKYSKLCVWVESDGSNRNLAIQFGENDNNFRKSNFPLSTKGATDYCVPLNTQPSIDLRRIGYYGIYLEGPPQGQGVIYLDNVRLVP